MLLVRLRLCSLFIPHTTVPPEGQGGGDTSLPSSELLRADPRQHLLQAGHRAPASGHVLLICNGDTWGHGVPCTTLQVLYNLVPSEPQSHAKDTTPHLICGPQATHGSCLCFPLSKRLELLLSTCCGCMLYTTRYPAWLSSHPWSMCLEPLSKLVHLP